MSTGARVPSGMAVWRTVATQGRATHLARPQMNPSGANLIEKIREELSEASIVGCSCCGYDFTGGFIHTYL
jgi:hypothetical protein